jgi:hypothetical protein
MNDFNFIQNTDKALANLIWNNIKQEPKIAEIVTSEEQITFASPKAAEAKKTKKLSIFLYNITQEPTTRNTPTVADQSGKRMPQTLFILHYLFAPCTGNEETDHALLGKIMQCIAASPIIAGAGAENDLPLKIKLDALSLDDLSKFWTSLGTPLKLTASYSIEAIGPEGVFEEQAPKIAAAMPTSAANETVVELYQAVLKTFTEQSDGWKKRNIFQKQWVFQDFKKVTYMSIEEMTTALNSLGDKIDQHKATAQFIKPLNALAEYYEHMLTELKGMEKFSKKQKENVELVTQWIKDIKALAAALSS